MRGGEPDECGECGALATRKQLVRLPVQFVPELPGMLAGRQEPTLTAGHHMVPEPTWGQDVVVAALKEETAALKAELERERLELQKKRQREGQQMEAEAAAAAELGSSRGGVRESKSCVVS